MDGAAVITRALNEQEDLPFIYATWRNSAYYGAVHRRHDSADEVKRFFKEFTATIRQALEKAQVRIACLSDDKTHILGYIVTTGKHLNWVYVKESYRRQGIANLLGLRDCESYPKETTKIGQEILNKKKELEDGRKRDEEAKKADHDSGQDRSTKTTPGDHPLTKG